MTGKLVIKRTTMDFLKSVASAERLVIESDVNSVREIEDGLVEVDYSNSNGLKLQIELELVSRKLPFDLTIDADGVEMLFQARWDGEEFSYMQVDSLTVPQVDPRDVLRWYDSERPWQVRFLCQEALQKTLAHMSWEAPEVTMLSA